MSRTGNFGNGFFGRILLLVCFACGLTACQVGLGAAVDTSDPRAAVMNPVIDGVIGGSVLRIEGTCEDDSGIAEVKIVKLRETNGLVEYNDLGNATLSDDGRNWTLEFTQAGSSKSTYSFNGQEIYLPDGTYEIHILPVDNEGRFPKNEAGRSFKIDNTPPFFLITSPNSINADDPSPYGTTVKVKGVIYDTSEGMSSINISVYDNSGNEKILNETADIASVQGKDKDSFEVLIAKQDAEETNAKDNFDLLYNGSENKYFMEIELEDMANNGSDLPGNKSNMVYFRAPLFEKIKKELGVSSISGSDLIRGYNGSHETYTSDQKEKMKKILDGTYDDDTSYYAKVSDSNAGRLVFSVNPNNTPKYSFGGMAFDNSSTPSAWSGRGAAGGAISLSVTAGSDEYLVKPDTIVVKLTAVRENGSEISNSTIYSSNTNTNGFKVTTDSGLELGSTGVESATYIVTLPDNLSETYYKLELSEGWGYKVEHPDYHSNLAPVKSTPGGYGFMLYSNKMPVNISSVSDLGFVKKANDNKYNFAISISDPNPTATINKATGKIKYQVQTSQEYKTKQNFTSSSWEGKTINIIEGTSLTGSGPFGATISDIPFEVNNDLVGTIALRIWGDNGAESEKNVYLLYVDNRNPKITVNNDNELGEQKKIAKNSPYYSAVDGTYTISGTWQDVDGSGVKDLQYSMDGTNYTSILDSPYSSRVTDKLNWSKNIPVTEGSNKSFYIKAIDLVGNDIIKDYEGIEFDFTAPELNALKYAIGDGDVSEAVGIVAVNEKTLTLYGTYSDAVSGVQGLGFKIGSASVTPTSIEYTTENVSSSNIDSLADSAWTACNAANAKTIKGWKATFASSLFGSGGTVSVTGTDVAGNTTTVSSVTLKKDSVNPTVSNISIVGAYKKNDTTYYVNNEKTPQITIKGVSSDDYSLKDTTITIPGLSPITVTGTSWQEDNVNISGLTGESVTISIKSNDTAGNESVATNITLNFDKVAPSRVKNVKTKDQFVNSSGNPDPWGTADNWSDSSFTVGGGVYYAESYSGSTTLRINGQFSESGSGINAVYYQIVNGETALSLNETNYNSFNSIVPASDGKFTTMLTGLQEGKNNLRLIAVDNVGNVSKITDSTDKYESDFVLGLDQTAPVFGNGFALQGSDEYVTGTSNFTISGGSVNDDRAGVNPGSIKFWFVNKNNSSTKYEITRTSGTYGQLVYTQTDPTDSNLSADITINVTPGSWFTEENLGTSPILYGSMTDYSNPANSSGTVTILTTLKLDHKEPEIEIDSNLETTPITDENANGKIKKVGTTYYYELTGSWSDTGSGTNKLFYATDGGATDGSWHDADDLGTDSSGEKNYNYAKSKAESTWSLKIPVTEGYPYNFAVRAQDVAGNIGYDKPNKTVTFDFTKPTVSVNLASGTYGASLPTGITRDANNRPPVTITAQDHYKVKATGGITVTTSASASDYTLSGITFADDTHQEASQTLTFRNDGEFEFTFTATDENGRTSDSVTRTWIVDTVSPAAKADNDSTYGLKINGAAAKEWYRDTNLKFDGFVDEKVSGLKTVYYLVDETEGVTADYVVNNGNQQNYAAKKNNGSIPVEYSVTPTVPTGTSYVHMVFEDVAGNRSAVKNITIKIDKTTPTFGKRYYSYEQSANYNEIEGNVLSNGANDLYIVGSYSDSNSGVDELAFYISGTKLIGSACEVKYSTVDIEADGSNIGSISSWQNYSSISDKTSIKSYRAKIAKSSFVSGGAVDAEPKDVAGNGSTQTIFTIAIDNQAPVLTLNTPKTKCVSPSDDETVNTVNGTITFAGTTEESSMDKLELYWGTSSSATADIDADHLIGTKTAAQSYNWSFSVPLSSVEGSDVKFIDGTSYSGSTKDIYLKLIATDKAGNTAKYVYKYIVNPDDDRPIITFTQLDLSGLDEDEDDSNVWLTDNKKMTGNVIDDDGVSELWYSLNGGTWTKLPDANGNTFANGNFTYTFTAETKYSMKFKVKDGAGTTFETKVSPDPQYLAPKFVGTNPDPCNYSILNLAVDISSPVINNVKYIANNGTDQEASTDFTLKRFGGDWKKVKIQFNTSDTNGIKTAKVSFNGNDYAASKVGDTDTYITNDYIPLNDLASKNYTAEIIVTDNANREGKDSTTATFVVDNKAPEVTISSPSGIVSTSTKAVGSLSEANGLSKVYFMLAKKNEANPAVTDNFAYADENENENGAGRWKEYVLPDAGASTFEIAFDSASGDNHTDLLKYYLVQAPQGLDITTLDAINGTNGATRYTDNTEIDLHIKAVDSYGNIGYGKKTVTVDPQGDKPTVSITYPVTESKLGGSIPIMGTAIDNVRANYVMLMMDMNGDGKWNKADIDTLNALTPAPAWRTWGKFDYNSTTKKYEWTDRTYNQIISETSSFETDDVRWTKYGIKVPVNNASWNITVNQGGELNPDSGTQDYAIWVYATDEDGNTSPIDLTDIDKTPYVEFTVDKDTPQIANEYLVQYDGNGFAESNITAKYPYNKDMSIKGEWYYEADMYDESGIAKVTRYTIMEDGASTDPVPMTAAGNYDDGKIKLTAAHTVTVGDVTYTNTANPSADVGFHIRMRVGLTASDEVVEQHWKLIYQEIKDVNPSSGEHEVALKVDNKAPVIVKTEKEPGVYEYYNIRTKITNENGFYTFGTQAKEDAVGGVSQTGVKRIAFYFTRDLNTPSIHSLYDVMIAPGETGNAINGYTSGLSKEDGLYWKSLTGTASGKTFTLTNSNPNVHTGGLVKINGVIYRIKQVEGNTVTVEIETTDGNPFAGVTSAKFALANIVDNTTEENANESSEKSAGYYTDVNFDDGDLMVESLKKQSTTWTWEANINSKNIGDGSAVMHFVVFDAAGNFVEETVNVFVANNQPRIAGVTVKTDTDGNNAYSADISETKSLSYEHGLDPDSGKMKTSVVFPVTSTKENPVSLFTIRNKTAIIPEIVGGNGSLNYTLSLQQYVDASTGWANAYKTLAEKPLKNDEGSSINGTGDDFETTPVAGFIEFEPKDMVANAFADGNNQKVNVLIKDSTPGGSLSVDLSVILNFKLHDSIDPDIKIRPLYWNNKDDNSLFGNSTKNGHIELPKDLPVAFTVGNADKEMDRHPKLSGKVRFEGVAQDDSQLSEIKITLFGLAEQTLGTYNGSWTSTKPLTDGAIPAAGYAFEVSSDVTYGDLLACGIITSIPSGKRESDDVPQFAEYGHVAKWTAYVDTEKIMTSKVADCDQTISVKAWDRGSPNASGAYTDPNDSTPGSAQSGGNDGTEAATGFYTVDVVPYITGITTKLSAQKKSNPSVYARTAKGHYAVASDESLKITGFNLAGGKVSFASAAATVDYDASGVAIPDDAKSGEIGISVTVGGNAIKTLNNKNNNESKGSYSGTVDLAVKPSGDKTVYDNYYYNRLPNGDNNNLLTDDVILDIWQINPQAAVPISGSISQPVMAINPINHDVGFAFVNGALYYSMPNGSSYSYDNFIGGFDYWTSVAMAYDSLGNSYGTAAGGDINETKADQFRIMTSRWGYADRDAGGYNKATNNLRLELIGQYDYTEDTYEGFRNFDKERIRSPSLATGSATSDSTTVYLAYYDAINDEIRFKWGELKTTKDNTWKNLSTAAKTASFFGDYYGPNTSSTGASEAGDKILGDGNDYSKYRLVHNSWLAGQTSRIYNTSGATRDAKVVTTEGTPVYAGQYVSIAAIPGGGTGGDDAVVAVWWDANSYQLLYSYNLTPKSIAVGQYAQADTKWSTPVPIFDANIGEYCKLAVVKESNNNYSVHIVGYDGLNCDVWYAYIPSFTSPSSKKTCMVDSYGLIGTELNIDVALDSSGNSIPYISYYAGSCAHPKTAHWTGTTSLATATATTLNSVDDEEYFTGAWEVSVIPTQSRVSVDHINIGVWKDSNGTITWSTTDGTAPADDNSNIGETKLDYKEVFAQSGNTGYRTGGHVWGNGSKNPILGYAITKGANGYIETAQMK